MADGTRRTTCVIVGGGPAGVILGLLLARAGIRVTVLEKHADFLRDFRGDTVHPSTLRLLDDLGLFDRFAALPQSRIERLQIPLGDGTEVTVGDFTRLRIPHPYVALVPQWELLDLLADAARAEPGFTLLTEHEVTGVVWAGAQVAGVAVATPTGDEQIRADLVVGCDGRWSVIRSALGLSVREFPVPFDVWWYRVTVDRPLAARLLPRIERGRIGVGIPRDGYVQVALLGPKGTDAAVRAAGIEAFRAQAGELMPDLAADVGTIATMDDVKHLDVRLNRLHRWHVPGALCIGDAAHAMSPMSGVGINLAIQDAVAAADVLAGPLRAGTVVGPRGARILARVRRRRWGATVVIQGIQRFLHARLVAPVIAGEAPRRFPRVLVALLRRVPALTAIPAAVVGLGPRPERAPEWARRPSR